MSERIVSSSIILLCRRRGRGVLGAELRAVNCPSRIMSQSCISMMNILTKFGMLLGDVTTLKHFVAAEEVNKFWLTRDSVSECVNEVEDQWLASRRAVPKFAVLVWLRPSCGWMMHNKLWKQLSCNEMMQDRGWKLRDDLILNKSCREGAEAISYGDVFILSPCYCMLQESPERRCKRGHHLHNHGDFA